ncbi:MAG: M23 family metallopeptidase [Clostridia bacterium]|nr:M23 family metallopeptidase [Clostridia bacterium]
MKNQNENGKGASVKNKKTYFYVALGLAAILLAAAIIITSVALAGRNQPTLQVPSDNTQQTPNEDEPVQTPPDEDDEPVIVTPVGFANPVATMSVMNGYGFYHNATINQYYAHLGVDFTAEAGAEVYAVQAGTVEEVYTSDVLIGTRIVIDHGDGVKSVYEFVEAREGLKAGDTVARGEVIATVAEATGNEYKDGAHLHFEILENGQKADPSKYLTLEEK